MTKNKMKKIGKAVLAIGFGFVIGDIYGNVQSSKRHTRRDRALQLEIEQVKAHELELSIRSIERQTEIDKLLLERNLLEEQQEALHKELEEKGISVNYQQVGTH